LNPVACALRRSANGRVVRAIQVNTASAIPQIGDSIGGDADIVAGNSIACRFIIAEFDPGTGVAGDDVALARRTTTDLII